MKEKEISNLDLKIKILKEYLENGGITKIPDPNLIQDIINTKFNSDGKIDPKTMTSRLRAFTSGLLASHLSPPVYSPEHISEYISILQKDLYYEQLTIDTPEEFDAYYNAHKDVNNFLFRGQSEAKWRLYSKLQRHWLQHRLFEKQKSFQVFLETMVENGRKKYSENISQLLDKNNIDINNDIAVLGYLQHHGCPTPLLDWTFRLGNALYFALDGISPNPGKREIEDYFSVYYLEEEHFESGGERTLMNQILPEANEFALHKLIESITDDPIKQEKMKTHFKGRELLDRSQFNGSGFMSHMLQIKRMINITLTYFSEKDVESGIIFSLNNSNNILNQEGVFTWVSDPSKPLEMVAEEDYHNASSEDKETDYRFCNCLNINKKLKDHVEKRLEIDGINKEHIYSNLDIDTWDIFEETINS